MKLKCVSNRLNLIVFDNEGKPRRVREGETFNVKAKEIPAKWKGLVIEVDSGTAKRNVTNPAKGAVNEPAKS